MTDISIQNTLNQALGVYDSTQDTDEHGNYYGTLTKLGDAAANSTITVPKPHPATTLVVFDANQKPLTRFTAAFSNNDFVVSDADVKAMTQADAFVAFTGANPDSAQAKEIATLKSAKDIDAFFQTQADYALVTTPTYMLALTYRAANPAPAGTKPEDVTYSLSKLISSVTGVAYPPGMPDISISKFFFRDDDGVVKFGGSVDLTNMPFDPTVAGVILKMLSAAGPVNVAVAFDTNIGLNVAGTKISFSYKEIDIPLGGTPPNSNTLRIVSPSVNLTINPLFKFVNLEIEADFPMTVFSQPLDTKLAMVVNNIEIEVGVDVAADATLPGLPILKGVHFDNFGIGMGIIFEPPGFALGIQGAFHIGEGSTSVALDDDQFAIILDLEGDVPNPVFLSFYVPKLDLPTLITAFTDATVAIDVPVEFDDLSFHWCENPLEPYALPDGTLTKGGFGFSGYMNLFGLKLFANVQLDLSTVSADAVMGPLEFGKIFSLTGQGTAVSMKFDANGNPISNNTIPKTAADRQAIAAATSKEIVPAGGPELHLSTAGAPYFKLDADATLFGVTLASVHALIDNSGLTFDLTLPLAAVTCKISTAGSLAATFAYGPDFQIPLPGDLGTIHLQATIDFAFSVTVTATDVTLSASGGFSFMGLPLMFGPVTIDVDIAGLEELVDACYHYIVSEAESIFGDVIKDGLTWARNVVSGAIAEVENVAAGLKDYFQHTIEEAASIMHDVGLDPTAVASDLKGVYTDATAEVLISALSPFGLTTTLAGTILQSLGFSANDIGQTMSQVFGLDAAGTAALLNDLGLPAQDIATVLQDVFTLSPNTISDVLKTVGYPVQVIADAFHALGGPFSSVGDALTSALTTVEHALDPSNW